MEQMIMDNILSLGIALTIGLNIGMGIGAFIATSVADEYEDLNIRLCQEQGYYEAYDKVIFCSVKTTEELIKRDLNGGG